MLCIVSLWLFRYLIYGGLCLVFVFFVNKDELFFGVVLMVLLKV